MPAPSRWLAGCLASEGRPAQERWVRRPEERSCSIRALMKLGGAVCFVVVVSAMGSLDIFPRLISGLEGLAI